MAVWEIFIKVKEEEQMAVYGGQMTAPKVLADIVKSMAASVYIDCGFNTQMMWSPITTMYGACRKDGKRVDIRYSKNGGRNIASVFVDDTFIASGCSDSLKNGKASSSGGCFVENTEI
ncbi:putative ribonuclease III, endonuclease domain superfamily [Helianthus anomalus]